MKNRYLKSMLLLALVAFTKPLQAGFIDAAISAAFQSLFSYNYFRTSHQMDHTRFMIKPPKNCNNFEKFEQYALNQSKVARASNNQDSIATAGLVVSAVKAQEKPHYFCQHPLADQFFDYIIKTTQATLPEKVPVWNSSKFMDRTDIIDTVEKYLRGEIRGKILKEEGNRKIVKIDNLPFIVKFCSANPTKIVHSKKAGPVRDLSRIPNLEKLREKLKQIPGAEKIIDFPRKYFLPLGDKSYVVRAHNMVPGNSCQQALLPEKFAIIADYITQDKQSYFPSNTAEKLLKFEIAAYPDNHPSNHIDTNKKRYYIDTEDRNLSFFVYGLVAKKNQISFEPKRVFSAAVAWLNEKIKFQKTACPVKKDRLLAGEFDQAAFF